MTDCEKSLAFDAASLPRRTDAPRLSCQRSALMQQIEIVNERGALRTIEIPVEQPLTVFVDKRELVTLMTLGASPELLVLGYLLNQGLIAIIDEVDSIDVDW